MAEKKSLMEKYMVPVEHLDFDYVKSCENVKELEQILDILKSGEEGYYPDLTACTEARLSKISPGNKLLRKEVRCREASQNDRKEINEFVENIKKKDQTMRTAIDAVGKMMDIPPIRDLSSVISADKKATNKSNRIGACDYGRWDKFDADTECLKIDLEAEQNHERTLIENKRNMQKSTLIEVLPHNVIEKLTETERQELANKHRIKGNEYFKCSEFIHAKAEYDKSLELYPTAAVFNNRALTYLKQRKLKEAIDDCDACLRLDPRDVKAMLRKATALIAADRKNEAYQQYSKVLKIDQENSIAKKAMQNIPIRLAIQDCNENDNLPIHTSNNRLEVEQTFSIKSAQRDDDDLKRLVIPKRIVPSKLSRAMRDMKQMCSAPSKSPDENGYRR